MHQNAHHSQTDWSCMRVQPGEHIPELDWFSELLLEEFMDVPGQESQPLVAQDVVRLQVRDLVVDLEDSDVVQLQTQPVPIQYKDVRQGRHFNFFLGGKIFFSMPPDY